MMNSLEPKIKKYILIFISFLAIFGLWMLLSYDKTEPKPKFKEEFAERPASKIDDIQIKQLEEGRIITIESPDVNDHFDIGHEKFYQQEWRRNISLGIDDERQKKGEYYFLHSYDIDTKKEGKKIDIFALIRKYNPNAGVKLPGEVVYYQGKDYFRITLQEQDKKKKGFYPLKEVFIDYDLQKDELTINDKNGVYPYTFELKKFIREIKNKYNSKLYNEICKINHYKKELSQEINKENKFTNVWTETNRKKEILRNTIKQSQKLYNSIFSEKQLKLDLVINSERVNLSKKLIDTLAELAEKEAERQKLLFEYEKLLLKREGFVNKIEIEEMFRDRKEEELKGMNRKV